MQNKDRINDLNCLVVFCSFLLTPQIYASLNKFFKISLACTIGRPSSAFSDRTSYALMNIIFCLRSYLNYFLCQLYLGHARHPYVCQHQRKEGRIPIEIFQGFNRIGRAVNLKLPRLEISFYHLHPVWFIINDKSQLYPYYLK